MKKIVFLLLLLAVSVFGITACLGSSDTSDGGSGSKCKDGHTYDEYESNNDATCTKDGTKTAKCQNCQREKTVEDKGSKLGHTLGEFISDGNTTCTSQGTVTAKCIRCDYTETKDYDGDLLEHEFIAYKSNNDATCQSNGTKTARCENCSATDTIEDENSKKVHVFDNYYSDGNATCGQDGTKTARCESCDIELHTVVDEGSKLPHDMAEPTVTKNPTCTEAGKQIARCRGCTYYEENDIPALNHEFDETVWGFVNESGHAHKCACGEPDTVYDHVPGPAATESEPQVCLDCGYVIAAAIGHTHIFNVKSAVAMAQKTPASCDEYAVYWYSCRCNAISTEEYFTYEEGGYLPHDYKDADCGNPKTCKNCGHEDGAPVGDHDFLPATCSDPKTCKVCGHTEGSPIGHNFVGGSCTVPSSCSLCGAPGVTSEHNWRDATCTEPKTCKSCGATTGEANGHTLGPATCTTPKTCTTPGCYYSEGVPNGHSYVDATCTDAKKCSICGHTDGKALGHHFGDWVIIVAPTYEADGEQRRDCDRTGCDHYETKIVPDLNPDNDGNSENMDPNGWTPVGN